jgi:tetratricopeptide (TPR) repeat protein
LPHGYFYQSYIYALLYSQDRTNRQLDSLLKSSVDIALEKGNRYKKENPDNPEAFYYLGATNGILGIYHVLNSSYIKGYIHGRRGKNYLQDAIRIDSTYYDAYLGLGIFHYYVDLLPGILKLFAGILGFHGDRALGMKEIRLTASQGQFFKPEGEFTYAVFRYFLEGEKQNSLQIFKKLNQTYPENPALTLLIGYHYRRHGRIKLAEDYFKRVSESFTEQLPQITVMKYYNLGVCYYRMNKFPQADQYFNRLLDTSLRKSPYYVAAIAYYKGILAAVQNRKDLADHYFRMIRENKDTQYWYNISRIYTHLPFDTVMQVFIKATNNVYSFERKAAKSQILWLVSSLEQPGTALKNSYMEYLIRDLQARFYFQKGMVVEAKDVYESIIDNLNKFRDEFHRAWIYIAYARVLRELQEWEKSEKMLRKAENTGDEYTLLIIEREKYILKNLQNNRKS